MSKWLWIFFLSSSLFAVPKGTYGPCREVPEATHLKIIETEIEVKGKTSKVFEITQASGDSALIKSEGKCFNVILENQTSVPTTLHWHGLILPVLEDGVAYVTQLPIQPGKSQAYNFEIIQAGTFWMHSHFGLQEQKLMSAPLILLPPDKNLYRDVIVFFEAFTFKSIKEVWLGLRKEFMEMLQKKGKNWKPNLNIQRSKHAPIALNDVSFDAFLTNRKTLEKPEVQIVKAGEILRLRLINGSVGSGFHIDLGTLQGKIIAVDGNSIIPISFNSFPLATAQRADVLVTIPKEGGVFPILAQCQGTNMRTGLILKTQNAKTPTLSSIAQTTAGAITNNIEKDFRAKEPLKPRKVDRVLMAELEGNMKFYTWAINNFVWPNDKPLYVKEGERVELIFVNKTPMAHPMHLHGHVFQVVEIDGEHFSGAMRDSILVMPDQTVKIQFDANNPGIWAMHCHIAYHLWAGMFTVVQYEGYKPPSFTKQQIQNYTHTYGGY